MKKLLGFFFSPKEETSGEDQMCPTASAANGRSRRASTVNDSKASAGLLAAQATGPLGWKMEPPASYSSFSDDEKEVSPFRHIPLVKKAKDQVVPLPVYVPHSFEAFWPFVDGIKEPLIQYRRPHQGRRENGLFAPLKKESPAIKKGAQHTVSPEETRRASPRALPAGAGDKLLSCPVCAKTYVYPANLRSHLANEHIERKAQECLLCGKHYTYPAHLKKHLRVGACSDMAECRAIARAESDKEHDSKVKEESQLGREGGESAQESEAADNEHFKRKVCGSGYSAKRRQGSGNAKARKRLKAAPKEEGRSKSSQAEVKAARKHRRKSIPHHRPHYKMGRKVEVVYNANGTCVAVLGEVRRHVHDCWYEVELENGSEDTIELPAPPCV